jgi:hypothetical protein
MLPDHTSVSATGGVGLNGGEIGFSVLGGSPMEPPLPPPTVWPPVVPDPAVDEVEPPVEPDTAGESLLQPIAKCSSAHAPKAGANRESLVVEIEMESNGYVRVVSGGANQHWLMFFGSAKRPPGMRRGATI